MRILRVDDRLVHGQVVAGWARPLGIQSLILASDRISRDEWACTAYKLAVPDGIAFACLDLQSCIQTIGPGTDQRRIMVVVEKIADAVILIDGGVTVKEVNIGGINYSEGARSIAPYIYLTSDEIEACVRLHQLGVKIIGRQLPNSPPVDVLKNLAGVK